MFSVRQETSAEVFAEDVQELPRQAETIEQAAERWRNNAFFTQEHFSKSFNNSEPGKGVFRLTEKDGNMYLEQFRLGRDGKAFHYAGLMFQSGDLYELTNVFVTASKARKAKENGGNL